jgi:hypothetical protein
VRSAFLDEEVYVSDRLGEPKKQLAAVETASYELRGLLASVVGLGKRSGERRHGFSMPWVRNVQEITGEIQKHPATGRRHKTVADR